MHRGYHSATSHSRRASVPNSSSSSSSRSILTVVILYTPPSQGTWCCPSGTRAWRRRRARSCSRRARRTSRSRCPAWRSSPTAAAPTTSSGARLQPIFVTPLLLGSAQYACQKDVLDESTFSICLVQCSYDLKHDDSAKAHSMCSKTHCPVPWCQDAESAAGPDTRRHGSPGKRVETHKVHRQSHAE